MKNLYANLLLCISIISANILLGSPTRVYVRNCTPLRFDVTIDYEPSANISQTFFLKQAQSILPYDISDSKSVILEIDRSLPEGEYTYTIKLISGSETLYLKQKCICAPAQKESDLGISLASSCIQDPWYMNNQAKEKHEHLINVNGHTIIVIYYAYETAPNNEDIEYSFYEQLPLSAEIKNQTTECGKSLSYRLALPIYTNKRIKETSGTLPYLLFNNLSNIPLVSQTIQQRFHADNQHTLIENESGLLQQTLSPSSYIEQAKTLTLLLSKHGINKHITHTLSGQDLATLHELGPSGNTQEQLKLLYKNPYREPIATSNS